MTFSWKLSSFYSPKKTPSGVVTAGKPVIGSQSYSREIQTVGPKIKIGLFAVGRPTLQNWGRPNFFYCSCDKKFFFRFAFAVNPDLYFSGLIRILL